MRRGLDFSQKKRRALAAGSPFRFSGRQTPVMARLWATTGDAVARLDDDGDGRRVRLFLQGTKAQCLAADPQDPDTVYVGLRETGIRKTTDGGGTWHECELPEPGVFSLAVGRVDGAVYAGTEPSRLFRSDNGGDTRREPTALLELPSRPTWSFPPRPWTSHVRWIAPSPHDADLLLVGIELGGLMRSCDGGATWQDHRPGAQRDVHSLAWHPHARDPAYEAGGGGTPRAPPGRARGGGGGGGGGPRGPRGGVSRGGPGGGGAPATTRGRWRSRATIPTSGSSRRAPVRSPLTAAAIRRRGSTGGATANGTWS